MENVQLGGGLPGGGDRVCELLTTVLEVLGEAGSVRGWDGSVGVLRARVGLAQRVVAVAEAVRLGVLRQVQARPEVVPAGEPDKVAATVLVHGCRVDPRAAARDVGIAQACDPDGEILPLLGAALAAGEVSRAHVEVATAAVARIPAGVKRKVLEDGRTGLGWIDAFLTEQCRAHPPGTVRALVREMLAILDPDRAAPDDGARRGLRYRTAEDGGMVVGSFALTQAEGLEVVAALEALAAPHPDGTALTPDGREQVVPNLRSRPQRLADALHAMAEIAMSTPSPHPRTEPDTQNQAPDQTQEQTPDQTQDQAPDQTQDQEEEARGPGKPDPSSAPQPGSGPEPTPSPEPPRAPEPQSPPEPPRAPQSPPESVAGRESVVGRRARADLSVLVSWEQLVAAGLAPGLPAEVQAVARAAGLASTGLASMGLAGGGDRPGSCLAPSTLARLACDGVWRRVLLGPSGSPLDLGRAQRTASPAQRAALAARDGGCIVPGCAMPVSWSDIHHHIPWAHGGRTDLDNLYPACGRHHTQLHAGVWQVEWHDGLPWVRPPAAIDPTRPLLRNTTRQARHAARVLAQQLALQIAPDRHAWPPPPPVPDPGWDREQTGDHDPERGPQDRRPDRHEPDQDGRRDGRSDGHGRSSACRLRPRRDGIPAPRAATRPPDRPHLDIHRPLPHRSSRRWELAPPPHARR